MRGLTSAASGLRTLLGVSVFWVALAFVFDGVTVLVLPAILAGLVEEGRQASVLGIVTFVGLLGAMVVQPPAGALSDRLRPRFGRRPVLTLGALGVLAGLFVLALASGAGPVALLLLAIGYLVVQLAASTAQAAQQGFIPDLIAARTRGRAAGWKGAADVGGAFLAFLLLGTVIEQGGATSALAAVGLTVAVALLITVVLVRERGSLREPVGVDLRRAFSVDTRRAPSFRWLVISRFLFLLATYGIGRFFLLFVAERLGLEPQAAAAEAGGLLAAISLLTAVAAIPAGWAVDRVGRGELMLAGALLASLAAVLLVAATAPWQILVFGGLLATGTAAYGAGNWAATVDAVPSDEAGRYLAVANVGTAGAAAVAGLAGPLIDLARERGIGDPYALLLVAAAVVFVSSALALTRIGRRLRGDAARPASRANG